jgi:hypothetical protein
MKRLLPLLLLLPLCVLPAKAATWFVNANGGTRYASTVPFGQCNGQAATAYPGTTTDTWTPGKSVSIGYTIADNNGHYETVTTAGTTNGTLSSYTYPTWGTSTVVDGSAVWTEGVTYPVNQKCPYMQAWMLWSANDFSAAAWVIAGGDTVIIDSCKALGTEMSPDNPHCRLGYLNNYSHIVPNANCAYTTSNSDCYNPVIPSGTANQHTRFLSTCAAAGNCPTGGLTNPKLYKANLTQLYGGFGLFEVLNLQSTQYVDFQGFELTTHNGKCSTAGIPALGGGCKNTPPYADYASHGIATNNTTANITFQDDYIHGMNADGLFGPIGGPITMTRTFVGFNGLAGWNFDDGLGTPDAAGSALNWHHTIWEGNGCQEEYPIVDTFPAVSCYSPSSGGFGDAISGQGGAGGSSVLDSFIADDYQAILNTKDGFIGPHIYVTNLSITHSISAFNGGQQWKWGGGNIPQNVLFESNLTVAGCGRLSAPMATGPFGLTAPSGYNAHFVDPCRAYGDVLSSSIAAGSTWNVNGNTFIDGVATMVNVACPLSFSPCPGAVINWHNNIILGYSNIPTPGSSGCCGTPPPAVFYNQNSSDITINTSYNLEYNVRNGSTCGGTILCADPLLLDEPAQSVTAQSDLDVFTNTVSTSGFYPTISSPAINAGTTGGPSTDYFGAAQTSPATIGAVATVGGGGGTPAPIPTPTPAPNPVPAPTPTPTSSEVRVTVLLNGIIH